MIINTQFYTKYIVRACSMFYPYEGYRSVTPLDAARVNRTILYIYKDRAAPPIGGPALHDGGVKTVQWTKRECHDSYQEVEVYIYKYIYRQIFVKKLWH